MVRIPEFRQNRKNLEVSSLHAIKNAGKPQIRLIFSCMSLPVRVLGCRRGRPLCSWRPGPWVCPAPPLLLACPAYCHVPLHLHPVETQCGEILYTISNVSLSIIFTISKSNALKWQQHRLKCVFTIQFT